MLASNHTLRDILIAPIGPLLCNLDTDLPTGEILFRLFLCGLMNIIIDCRI